MLFVVCQPGLYYLLEWGLCLDAFAPHEDPAVPEAQRADYGAAQVRNQLPGFIVESAEPLKRKSRVWRCAQRREFRDWEECAAVTVLCCWIIKGCHHDDGPLLDLLQEFDQRSHLCSKRKSIVMYMQCIISLKNKIKKSTNRKILTSCPHIEIF